MSFSSGQANSYLTQATVKKSADTLANQMREDGWLNVNVSVSSIFLTFKVTGTDPLSGESHVFTDEYDYDAYKKA